MHWKIHKFEKYRLYCCSFICYCLWDFWGNKKCKNVNCRSGLTEYFNLKSGKRLDVLILLAFLVFLNIQKIKQSGEAWPVVNNLVHPRSSNYKKLSNSGRNYFLNLNAESWTEVLEREFGCYPFWQKVNYLTFTIIRYPIVCTN